MPGVKLVGSLDENEEPAKGFRAVVWIQFEQRDNNPNGRVYVVIDDKGMQYAESDALRNVLQTIVDEPFAHPDYITLLTSAQAFLNGGGRQDVFSLDITFANPNDHQRTSDHILHFLPLLHHYLIRV